MKFIFIALTSAIILFNSCSKDCEDPAPPVPKTKTEMLTSKTWIYDEYFTNYNNANTVLAYKRGKPNNTTNLAANRSKFNMDGTLEETNQNGQNFSGTWVWLNNETQLQITNQVGVFTANVITLSDSSFVWLDPTATNGTLGKQVPL